MTRLFLALCLLTTACAAFGAEIISSDRRTTWQGNAGVPGGIPDRQTISTTLSSGASLSTVQAAIEACPSNQVVVLGAGSYSFSGDLFVDKNGVTLRGSGVSNTTVSFSAGHTLYIGNQNWETDWFTPNASRHKNWTSGLTQGSTSITIAAAGDLAVGELIYMDMLNDTNVDAAGACNGPVGGIYTSVAQSNVGADRWDNQMNRVIGISGTTVTLSEPVYMPIFANGSSPQIWWYGAQPVTMAGVEDLKVQGSNNGGSSEQSVYFQNAYGCWLLNCNVTGSRKEVNFLAACRCEMRHCYVFGPQQTTDDYLVQTIASSGLLVTDNITDQGAWILQSCSGCVFSYNYLRKTTGQSGNMQGGLLTHGGNPNMNLFEGNYVPGVWWQNCWGSSVYNTAFRNRIIGKDESATVTITDDIQGLSDCKSNRVMNVVGNIIGLTNFNTWYYDGAFSYTCHSTGRDYWVGCSGSQCSGDFDVTTSNTLVWAVNWASAIPTNGGLVLSGGFTTGDLSNSYYLATAPTNFGILTWPPYSPNNISAASIDKTNIPAGFRFVNGIDPPAGTSPTITTNSGGGRNALLWLN